jgi:hypothetical protein
VPQAFPTVEKGVKRVSSIRGTFQKPQSLPAIGNVCSATFQLQWPPHPMSRFQALGVRRTLVPPWLTRTTWTSVSGPEGGRQRRFASCLHKQHPPRYLLSHRITPPSASVYHLSTRLPCPKLVPSTKTHGFATMETQELKHYLADAPPSVVRLEIEKHFEALSDQQKRYAHFISK